MEGLCNEVNRWSDCAKVGAGRVLTQVLPHTDSQPPEVSGLLSVNLTQEATYYEGMASLAPLGLIPALLDLEDHKDHKRDHDRLFDELSRYRDASKDSTTA